MVEFAVGGGQKMQGHPGILHVCPDVIGDGTGVVHEAHGVLEHIGVDALQHILSTRIRLDLEGGIDVAVAEGGAGHRLAPQAESKYGLFHKKILL